MNEEALYSPCVAVVVEKSPDGTKHVTADDHASREKQSAQRAPVIHPRQSGSERGKRTVSFCGMRDLHFESLRLQSHFGFYCFRDDEKSAKVGHLAQRSVRHLCGALVGIPAQRCIQRERGRERAKRSRVTWVGVDETTRPRLSRICSTAHFTSSKCKRRNSARS